MKISEAIEQVLISSELSMSAFSRKSGFSRQYLYQLIKNKPDNADCDNVQLSTLKKICDTANYNFERFLADVGYVERSKQQTPPNTVIIVGQNGDKTAFTLSPKNATIVTEIVKALHSSQG